MSAPNASGSGPQEVENASSAILGTAPNDNTVDPSVACSSSAWGPTQNWSTARRGHSDGHMMARDAATSMSRENNVAPSRPATVKRKRFVDVGQKTVKQMNELARYVNAKGPCAICRTPGAVITLTQIRRRRRKFLRYLKSHEGSSLLCLYRAKLLSKGALEHVGILCAGRKGATKGSADIWPPESTPLLTPSAKAQKSVSWVEHPPEAQSDARPDYLTSDTGAFLLLLSLVALVIGILVIFKATGNSLKEYLGLITPATSVSSALPGGSQYPRDYIAATTDALTKEMNVLGSPAVGVVRRADRLSYVTCECWSSMHFKRASASWIEARILPVLIQTVNSS
ncbi:hypothetical protein HPB51_018608 [Rhipicephalus microplus]|uniref:Uncharacterized protein n=1 Tax=Rhipicephalus microplus TaxID=6941 RepID=A0A9J6DBC6_RHIMP|nr:hypothetical protein HPB51_018608 [Rhipicephalus microplus]